MTTLIVKNGTPDQCLVGQRLDRKSSLCLRSVQALSIACPNAGKIQGLSNRCPRPVKCLSKLRFLDSDWTRKSSICPNIVQSNDLKNTKFHIGHTLDKLALGQYLDFHFWQCLLKICWTNYGQLLDMDRLLTYFGRPSLVHC